MAGRHAIGWPNAICLLASGVGIGFLMGMSVSPVAGVVIAGLLGVMATVIALFTGVGASDGRQREVTAFPLLLIVLAIVGGGQFGVWVRTRWLAPEPATLRGTIAQWTSVTGLPDTAVARRIFERTSFEAFKPEALEPIGFSTSRLLDPCKDSAATLVEYNFVNGTSRKVPASELCPAAKRPVK